MLAITYNHRPAQSAKKNAKDSDDEIVFSDDDDDSNELDPRDEHVYRAANLTRPLPKVLTHDISTHSLLLIVLVYVYDYAVVIQRVYRSSCVIWLFYGGVTAIVLTLTHSV